MTARLSDDTVAWLMRAAEGLGLPGIPGVVKEALHKALPFGWDDPRYKGNALVPGQAPLEVSFVETDTRALRLDFEPCGPDCSPESRRELAAEEVRGWVQACFGQAMAREFERALTSLGPQRLGPHPKFGAFLGAACDARGLAEAKIYCELPGELPEELPPPLTAIAQAARSTVPGLTPHFASLCCDRNRCLLRLYLLCHEEVPLLELRHVLAAANLEHRLPELASLSMTLTGNMLVLPASSAVLSFREVDGGFDCKLELLARALPLPNEVLAENLRQMLSGRAKTRSELQWWSRALGGDGLLPGELNVVSFRASVRDASKIGVYVSPPARRAA